MAFLKTEKAYRASLKRIDELLKVTGDDIPRDDPNVIELDVLSDLVEEYENEHYPIPAPSLVDIIKLRMYEMGLNQKNIAELLDISPSKLSEIMHGKTEPSLSLGKTMSIKLNIAPEIILGI